MADKQMSITLRRLERSDLDQLHSWLNAAHVRRWWDQCLDKEAVIAKYEPRLSSDSSVRVYVIEVDGRDVGIIQCYQCDDCSMLTRKIVKEKVAGIDYLIGELTSAQA